MSALQVLALCQVVAFLRDEARICDTVFESEVMLSAAAQIELIVSGGVAP